MPALRTLLPVLAILALAFGVAAAAAEPRVVASIKPVHSLAAGVMAGIGTPTLLIDGAASPHSYSLRPSDARALAEADVVFWIGEGLETFLGKVLNSLAEGAIVVELADDDGLRLLPLRGGGVWAAHEDADDAGNGDGHAGYDPHLWLDPENAKRLVARMVAALSERDPANAPAYRRNGAAVVARLDALDRDLDEILGPVRRVPFLVFHDAFQYVEARYGLAAVGSVTLAADRAPGAGRVADLRRRIVDAGVVCVFTVPQFPPDLAFALVEDTPARIGEIDDLGAALPAGPDLYFQLLRGLAGAIRGCLDPTG